MHVKTLAMALLPCSPAQVHSLTNPGKLRVEHRAGELQPLLIFDDRFLQVSGAGDTAGVVHRHEKANSRSNPADDDLTASPVMFWREP